MRIHGAVLISGANRGIGLEITRSLLTNPNVQRVYAGSRNFDQIEALQKLPDPDQKLKLIQLDISKDWSIRDAFEAVRRETGKLNVLINNSAILETDHTAGIPNGERQAWLRHFDVNTVSHALVIQEKVKHFANERIFDFGPRSVCEKKTVQSVNVVVACLNSSTEMLPLLEKAVSDGETTTIINISGLKGSGESFTGNFEAVHHNLAYMCSKSAVNMLTKQVSILYPQILVVAMCPGWNRTSMGGPSGFKEPSETAPQMLGTVNKMTMEYTGQFWNRKGEKIPY